MLEHHQDVVWSGPDLKGESKEENLGSCVFGIARVCLHCSMSLILQVLSAVFFNAHKNESTDRQIGDRRWFNGGEYHPQAPSRDLPGAASMTSLHCPVDPGRLRVRQKRLLSPSCSHQTACFLKPDAL